MEVPCPKCKGTFASPADLLLTGVARASCPHCSFSFVIRLGAPGAGIRRDPTPRPLAMPVAGVKDSGRANSIAGVIGSGAAGVVARDTQTTIKVDDDLRRELAEVAAATQEPGLAIEQTDKAALASAPTDPAALSEVATELEGPPPPAAGALDDQPTAVDPQEPLEAGGGNGPARPAVLPGVEAAASAYHSAAPPSAAPPSAAPPGAAPPGAASHSVTTQGVAPRSAAPHSVTTQGVAPRSAAPHSVAPQTYTPYLGSSPIAGHPVNIPAMQAMQLAHDGQSMGQLLYYELPEEQPARSGARVAGLLITLALVVVGGFFLYVLGANDWSLDLANMGTMIDRAFGGAEPRASERSGLVVSQPSVRKLALADGPALVVEGLVDNKGGLTRQFVYVRVALKRHMTTLLQNEAPAGNVFTDAELKALTGEEIKQHLNPAGRHGRNTRLSSGQSIAYQVVLSGKVPADYAPDRYEVEAVVSRAETYDGR